MPKSLKRRNEDLMARLADVLSFKTGIPRDVINVREPSSTHRHLYGICTLCGKMFKEGDAVRPVIVQDQRKPVTSMQRLTLCVRLSDCVKRFKGQGSKS